MRLTKKEEFAKEVFEREHACIDKKKGGLKEFEIIQESNPIGIISRLVCKQCEKCIDITDYECW